MADEGGISTKSVLGHRRPKKQFLARSDIHFHFFPPTLNSFTLLHTDQNRSNSVSAEMVLGPNSVMPQIGGGGAEESKTKDLLFFKPID